MLLNATHDGHLRPVRLTLAHATRSYTLAWLAHPALTQPRWRAFIRAHAIGSKRGLMTIEDARGHVHALYRFQIDHDLSRARLLRVRLYAVSTFPGLDVHGALLRSLQAIAQNGGCSRIAIDFSECANRGVLSRDLIEQSGFEKTGDTYAKRL